MPRSYYDDTDRRIAIFEDTMEMCWDNPRLSDSIDETIARTKVYTPGKSSFTLPAKYPQASVSLTEERTIAAAARLHRKHPESRIAVLNFASATTPGGGVKSGSAAQEESLCRCTTLYQCLNTDDLERRFYRMHQKQNNLRYTDTCIYSPDVIAFKTDTRFPELLAEEDWFKLDVITCAAPNLRKVPYNRMNPGKGRTITLHDDELLQIHLKRGRQIAEVAAKNGADILILVHSDVVHSRITPEW